jgi:hypothetical protein
MSSLSITKSRQKNALADKIQRTGIEMPSCSRCERQGLSCVVASDTTRCGECVRSKSKCDVAGPSLSDWYSLEREEKRLEEEEKATLAKLLRLHTQKASLRSRGREMLRRGLKSLDELDAAEEAEKVAAAAIPLPTGDFEFPEIPLDPVEAAAFWASLDTGGEKLQASQGSS